MTGVLNKNRTFGHRHTYKENTVEHEDGHLQAKESRLEHSLPSKPSERTSPTNTLASDFCLQNCKTIHFCGLSHPVRGTVSWQP